MFVIISLSVIAGVVLKHQLLSYLIVQALIVYYLFNKYYKVHKKRLMFLFECISLICVSLLVSIYYHHNDFNRKEEDWLKGKGNEVYGEAVFYDDIKVDGPLIQGTLMMNDEPIYFSMYMDNEDHEQLNHDIPYFKKCNVVYHSALILPNTNINQFHYDEYLYRNGLKKAVELKEISYESCRSLPLNLKQKIDLFRLKLNEGIIQKDLPYMSYFIALTTGDTKYLSREEMNELKRLGIYHLYAVSGSHVALISVFLYQLLKRIYVPVFVVRSIMLLLLPAYAVFTGLTPSVIRSVIFVLLVMFLSRYRKYMLQIFSCTFLIHLLIEPFSIYDIGFQISYAICLSYLLILPLFEQKHWFKKWLVVSLVSQIAPLPFVLYHFNEYPLISFVTNIIFIPLFSMLLFPAGMICLMEYILLDGFHSFFMSIFIGIFHINEQLCYLFLKFIEDNRLDYVLRHHELYVYVLFYIAVLYLFSKWWRAYLMMITLMMILLSWNVDKQMVHFLDVGQGDSILIESGRKTMMVDTGGKVQFDQKLKRKNKMSLAERVHIPFLLYNGQDTIDYLLLTHPDIDHFGETLNIMKRIRVRHIILNPHGKGSGKYEDIIRVAKEKHIKLIDASKINEIKLDGMNVTLLNNDNASGEDENSDSLVAVVTHQNNSLLLTGDIDKETEREMSGKFPSCFGFKAAHHGSESSTGEQFLDQQQFRFAFISAGRHNRFNHPHETVIHQMKKRNIKIYDTRMNGRISVDFKKGSISTMHEELFE